MAAVLYVWIPNWDGKDGFQHYKNRDPIWIKNYTRLLSHDAYTTLSYHQRGILHSLWMEYARANRQLPGDTLTLTRRLGHRVLTRDLVALRNAGFIELVASGVLAHLLLDDASDPLALTRSRETEGETETKNPAPTPEPEPPLPESDDIDFNGAGAGSSEHIEQPSTMQRRLAAEIAARTQEATA